MKIPRLMCTQHPDATEKITAQQEVDEAIQAFTMYGCDEVMSDYEGKLTPYAQPKEIIFRSYSLGIPVGEEAFITLRIPNPSLEEFDRVDLAIEAGIVANYYSFKLLGVQAVKWFILPMVEDVDSVRLVQRLILRKLSVMNEELNIKMEPAQLIPLLEDIQSQLLIRTYVNSLLTVLKEFSIDVTTLRVFIGKSDAAVKAGHVASALSIMYALNELHKLSIDYGIEIKPIIGMGVPPFRGALNNPKLIGYMVQRYKGFSTATIQSAIRYDIPFNDYLVVKNTISENVGSSSFDVGYEVVEFVDKACKMYRELVSRYINPIQRIAEAVPSTRDRISWRSYGRLFPASDERFSVPRAIVYTSTWYAAGVPPIYLDAEFIIELYKRDELDSLLKLLPYLEKEWAYDSRFYVHYVALKRLDEYIVKKVNEALDIMGIKPEPLEPYRALLELNPVEPHITALGRIRGFLG
ncbi:MAG: phosphoenolpyruvate carboxylase [Ignisphaera sp.]|uniref:Phosphoenolpyruvate carboxylase n=1 Tax=Ignisphaera aggregans TaxID=334771 RepID=A0A7C4NN08_9CREN